MRKFDRKANNNKMKNLFKISILVVVLLLVGITLCACVGNNAPLQEKVAKCKTAIKVECSVKVTDNGIEVYSLNRQIEKDEYGYNVKVVEKQLGDGFQYTTDESETFEKNVDTSSYFPLTLGQNDYNSLEQNAKKGIYEIKINPLKLEVLLQGLNLNAKGDCLLKLETQNDSVTLLLIEFQTQTDKAVKVVYTYTY